MLRKEIKKEIKRIQHRFSESVDTKLQIEEGAELISHVPDPNSELVEMSFEIIKGSPLVERVYRLFDSNGQLPQWEMTHVFSFPRGGREKHAYEILSKSLT